MRTLRLPALSTAALLLGALPLAAQTTTPTVSLGAGLQSSYQFTKPDGADGTNQFLLNSARLYVSGTASKNIKFMFNTEYDGATNHDRRAGRGGAASSSRRKFNIWAGRFLPPSDRANLYGPYYAHHWGVYTDGVQDGYPFVFQGRDNGVVYWGEFGKVKVSGGAFDGASATGDDTSDRRRPRPGRFLGHGRRLLPERHLLRRQEPAGHRRRRPGAGRRHTAYNVDFLLEKKAAGRRRVHRRSRVRELRPAGRLRRALRQRARAPTCSAATCSRSRSGIGQVRGPRQVRQGELQQGHDALDTTTTRRPPNSTSTTSSSSSTRA